LRRENPALVDGSMRWLAAEDEAILFVREHKKQNIMVLATRGKVKELSISAEAVARLSEARLIYGGAELKVGKRSAHLTAGKLSFTVWRLPATKH
jgi:alpha-glucosidase